MLIHLFKIIGIFFISTALISCGGGGGGGGSSTNDNHPTASFTVTPTSGEAPLVITVDASSSTPVQDYIWDFGDGTTKTGITATHTYSESGTYIIELTVIDSKENSASTTKSITVLPEPGLNANFSVDATSGEIPFVVNVDGSASTNASSYSWDFGDNTASSGVTSSHTYTSPGNYTITLTVTGPEGGTHSAIRVINALGHTISGTITAPDTSVADSDTAGH